jgi:hypothetical protein
MQHGHAVKHVLMGASSWRLPPEATGVQEAEKGSMLALLATDGLERSVHEQCALLHSMHVPRPTGSAAEAVSRCCVHHTEESGL